MTAAPRRIASESPTRPRSPPSASLAFRVGLLAGPIEWTDGTGVDRLAGILGEILAAVRTAVVDFQRAHPGLYAESAPTLRAVTRLAQGADRVFGEQALDLGYALCCAFPFAQAESEGDAHDAPEHQPGSLGCVRALLVRAEACGGLTRFELEGDRADPAGAHLAAGRVVLNQSDLLIAVRGDGQPPGAEGLDALIHDAVQARIPVLWLDPRAPAGWLLVRTHAELGRVPSLAGPAGVCVAEAPDWTGLGALVDEILDLPPTMGPATHLDHPAHRESLFDCYRKERRPVLNLAIAWRVFRELHGAHRLRVPPLRVPDFEQAALRDWPDAPDVAGWVNRQLRPHYAWAGKLSGLYADVYRSSYVLAYLLAAVAVTLALLPGAVGAYVEIPGFATFANGAELLVIGIVLILIFGARHRHWHTRWMDYRLLAEMIRQLRFLIPLAGHWPLPRMPAHWETYGNPSRTWMAWHMRGIARATGLPNARVDQVYLRSCLAYLKQVIAGQRAFHADSARHSEEIDHSLHRFALWLLIATIVCIVAHLIPALHTLGPILTLACAGLPAFGAALHGIKNQGEFSRIAKRSQAMARQLEQLLGEIAALEGQPALLSADVTRVAYDAARLMVDEVLDWRVIFTDRPPVIPA
ncbi:hypothetical protein [Thiocapsa marina]|uniref:SMODS and SLOG-associating 2TM effector domain-containing protein n=1 Tax=Thiocapsa marina 5811 TaxID=768671 RepID=F9UHV9_9GAMM|nr:hypothetical protein [Thiocapsa marina]EGV16135.1 hypothetical protein ThimaDRAFT_4512 [Thiocapsa marina 5811]